MLGTVARGSARSKKLSVPAYIESGTRRVFACAVDWPGWCRSGKDEQLAIEALASYAPRYSVVAREAGIDFPTRAADLINVVDHVAGGATTDFGAPQTPCRADFEVLSPKQLAANEALVRASWAVLGSVALDAPASLRKGPRGGGRDRDAVVAHVLSAEAAYARKLGIRMKEPDPADPAAVSALRDAIGEILGSVSEPKPLVDKGWPVRYAARRIAWHALDHAWEIEDRSD